MTIYYILIVLLIVVIILLASTLRIIIKKSIYFSNKDKKYITFVIDIFKEYGEDLGVQSKEQHEALVKELENIKKKKLKHE